MAALLTDQFRIFSAKKFIKALEGPVATQSDEAAGTSRDRLYLFIGRPQSWDNENSPPQAVDSCLLYTSPSPRDEKVSRMPSSA